MKHKHKHKSLELIPYWKTVEAKSQKMIKYLQIGLSVLSVLIFMALSFHVGIGVMENKLQAAEQRAIKAEKVIEVIDNIEQEIKKYQPGMKQEIRFTTAVMIYTGSEVTKVPVNYQNANIKVETEFDPKCEGKIYKERGLHQILGTSFRKYYPTGREWGNPYAEYWAGMYHLQECYNLAMAITEEDVKQNAHYIPVRLKDKPLKEIQLALMLSLHNSGTGWRNIFKSFTVTQPHIARSLQQNVYEYLEDDRGLSV